MDRISRGDIWVVELSAHPKPRPAVVMSINPVNDLCPDMLVVPVTSKPHPLRIAISEGESAGLKTQSFAKCESLGPVHRSRLKKKIGRISKADLLAIEQGVRRILGL